MDFAPILGGGGKAISLGCSNEPDHSAAAFARRARRSGPTLSRCLLAAVACRPIDSAISMTSPNCWAARKGGRQTDRQTSCSQAKLNRSPCGWTGRASS
eukprot:CAMPEP_0194772950 /NCGR_PEP_ID=MMETSP0323_2-20130528/53431_1 /TAXON_ID=2866 ORGANISM="Crypthecodinium cohnii, Strain Seligo" /NCGR_SAMPLE_ID=MMETSP0323_2 /ASSEMBLY_ACC=CAM_ASM_000346 /LENGTH=98 /DNA_ID=CAMNT_0039707719 /DNA_START=30 /DNA_END=323 /DNA_ORIENTATION=+